MSSRLKRAQIAEETVRIVHAGWYQHPTAGKVYIAPQVQFASQGTIHYSPESFDEVFEQRDLRLRTLDRSIATRLVVRNKTTFEAAKELLAENDSPVLCLNFASAKNPGGGFLGGSQAQEECLARASALYHCIHPVRGYYDTNRHCGTCLYTHHMIYSPAVPVFRDDDDQLLPKTYCVSILTSPSVNRGAMETNESDRLREIEATMLARIDRIFAIAVAKGYRRIVLGAWGCGVFRNDPNEVADWFKKLLMSDDYRNCFETVMFGVWDNSSNLSTFKAFAARF
jgi:uncharacterized protein (TIGR02452 family)